MRDVDDELSRWGACVRRWALSPEGGPREFKRFTERGAPTINIWFTGRGSRAAIGSWVKSPVGPSAAALTSPLRSNFQSGPPLLVACTTMLLVTQRWMPQLRVL